MPQIGLGTWELKGEKCAEVVEMALEIGYRHIDTAHMYENHREIGNAIKSFPREKLFLVSKFMPTQMGKMTVEETCDLALEELGTDYLDLYLLHYPDRTLAMNKILSDLAELKEKGKVGEWGVSNFTRRHLQDTLDGGLHPACNQVEFHPHLYQKELLDFCHEHNITLVSYRSLGKGKLVHDSVVKDIAEKEGRTPAQILLRWCWEKGVAVIPKASTRERLLENFSLDFKLRNEDLMTLDHLGTKRLCNPVWQDFDY